MKIAVKNDLVVSTADDFILDNKGRYNHNISLTPDTCDIYDNIILPDNFRVGCYTYIDGVFEATPELQARLDAEQVQQEQALLEQKQALLLSEILALENQVTQRRLREAVLAEEGKAWLENIEQQIDDLRAEGKSKRYI